MLKFSDGMQFDTSGELRVTRRPDGYYVVGENMLLPVNTSQEGVELIKELTKSREPEKGTSWNET